ncbi:MAG: HAMP domain-containing histidine kinase, partial [Acidobacteriia bacterium]|nr:HAMP domain-containing histidine kinase [Terriglobia bacterium]
LSALVEQVLRFAAASAGQLARNREPVAVEALVERSLEAHREALEKSGVAVEKRIDPDLPPVLANELALRHALQNLIDNALKYGSPAAPWIGIFASAVGEKDGRAVEIRVADRGPGVPPGEQKAIFDPFFRGRRAVEDQIHGAGLGLDLVKKIVEAHGGSVRVESAPGKGSAFILRVPAA